MLKNHNFNKRRLQLLKNIKKDIPILVDIALKEDLNNTKDINNDISSYSIQNNKNSVAIIFSRENGIFCGKLWIKEIFKQLGNSINIHWKIKDGEHIKKKQILCILQGSTKILLAAERTVLNFIQTLCGIASTVDIYNNELKNTTVKLLDTRKTIPGLRSAEKYAVLCGGGYNHRLGLSDSILIKENHITATGSIKNAIKFLKTLNSSTPIEIEVENLKEIKEAIKAGADIIMLDNFNYNNIINAVKINKGQKILEVSGNIKLKYLRKIALTGIHYISIGALTKNIKALDISMILKR